MAQQTSLRNLVVHAGSGYSGIDVGWCGGSWAAPMVHPTPGGGGTVEDVTVYGGMFGLRASASQWHFRSIRSIGAGVAGISLPGECWTFSLVDVHVSDTPTGLWLGGGVVNVVLVQSSFVRHFWARFSPF